MPADLRILNLLIKAARNTGRLVYEHRQGEFLGGPGIGPWGVSYAGYCVAMAVEWCRLRLSNDDFNYDAPSKTLAAPPLAVLALHDAIVRLGVPAVLAAKGMKVGVAKASLVPPPNWARLKARLGEDGLFCVTFDDHKGGGSEKHVVAFQFTKVGLSNHTQRFFDANFGHVLFDDAAKFDAFMTKFLDNGYAAGGEYQSAYILPVAAGAAAAGRVSALKKKFGG